MDDHPGLPAPEVPRLDPDALGTLVEMLDDHEVVADIIRTFLEDTPTQLATLGQAVSVGDTPTATAAAHTVKGAAQILGALRLGELCAAFEEAPDAALSVLVLEEYDHVARELREFVRRLRTG